MEWQWTLSLADRSHMIVNGVALGIALLATVDIVRMVWRDGRRLESVALLALVWLASAHADGYVLPLGAIVWLAGLRWSFRNRSAERAPEARRAEVLS